MFSLSRTNLKQRLNVSSQDHRKQHSYVLTRLTTDFINTKLCEHSDVKYANDASTERSLCDYFTTFGFFSAYQELTWNNVLILEVEIIENSTVTFWLLSILTRNDEQMIRPTEHKHRRALAIDISFLYELVRTDWNDERKKICFTNTTGKMAFLFFPKLNCRITSWSHKLPRIP